MSRDDGALGKGEAEHAPSPLQQERDDVTRRNTLQAVWSGATKAKSRGRCNRSLTMRPGETHFRRVGAKRQELWGAHQGRGRTRAEPAATGARCCNHLLSSLAVWSKATKIVGSTSRPRPTCAPRPL